MTSWPLAASLAVLRLFQCALGFVELRLRDQLLLGELQRALVVPARKGDVRRLRLDLVLLQLRHRRFVRRFGRLQVGAGLAKACGKILLVQLRENLSWLHDVIDIDHQVLDDPVRLGLDFEPW
jgi:hypothetical protein